MRSIKLRLEDALVAVVLLAAMALSGCAAVAAGAGAAGGYAYAKDTEDGKLIDKPAK